MAVIKGVKVAIQVGGRGLQEYDVNETKPNSTVKYVQASTGAAFKIKLGVPKSFAFAGNALSFKVSVDGAYVDGLLCRKKKICTKAFDYVCEGSPNKDRGRWQLRPFVFQEIKQVENYPAASAIGSGSSNIANLGEIVVNVYSIKTKGYARRSKGKYDDLHDHAEVAEKDLKGKSVTHGAKFGKKTPKKRGKGKTFASDEVGTDPVATFTFKYCSKKALQGLMLIPRTPSPTPEPTAAPAPVSAPVSAMSLEERPIGELTIAEMIELAKRQQESFREQKKPNIKPEIATTSAKDVKRKRDDEVEELLASSSAKKVKLTRPMEPGEMMDLCDDE